MRSAIVLTVFLVQGLCAQVSYPPLTGGFGRLLLESPPRPQGTLDHPFTASAGDEEVKSVPLAAAYSLLLPGMGELYVGRYSSGKYFTIAEGALWLTYISFQVYGNWVQTDARTYAAQHARAFTGGKGDQYFVDIGNFNSIEEFNQEMLRERLPYKVYSPLSAYYWNWDNGSNREAYRQLRVSSDEVFNNSRFVIGAIVVNHIISAVNAARMAMKHNAGTGGGESDLIDIHARTLSGPAGCNGIMLSFSKTF